MISLYVSGEVNFEHNGEVVLDEAIECISTQELNKIRSLELTYPLDKRGKYLNIQGLNIIKAGGQLYRIPIQSNIQSNGMSVRATANHIFYDLNNDFNEDTRADNKTVAEALQIAIAVNPKFSVGLCDNLGLNTAYFVAESPTQGIYNKILPRWKGELKCDNYEVSVKQRLGRDTGILISYGKNIEGFEQRLDWSTLATKIKLVGKDGLTIDLVNGGSKYLISPIVNNYPFVITKEVKFENIEDATELKNAGLALWGTIDLPSVNWIIKFIDLSKTIEYADFKDLLKLEIGDSVIIRHKIFKCDLTARVIKIKKNEITDTILELELGQFKDNISNKFINIDKQILLTQESLLETREDLKVTKTTVFQNDETIKLHALAIKDTDDRVDEAYLQITADSIMSKVSNSQTYINDLGEKVTFEEASTISQTAANVKIGFNNINDIVDIDATGIKVSHGGADYTHMGATGFKRFVGAVAKSYHYLTYVGQVDIYSTNSAMGTVTIQLPDEFKGKSFVITCSFAGASTPDGLPHDFYGFGAFSADYDLVNARFKIYAYASWQGLTANVKNTISYTVIA